jgi:intracellular sulfur oxidation DsrE/DsrF family protein
MKRKTHPYNVVISLVAVLLVGLTYFKAGAAPRNEKQQPNPQHRVVVDLAVDGREAWNVAIRNVEHLRDSLGRDDTEVEVVAYAKGIGAVLRGGGEKDDLNARMTALADGGGVAFTACAATMKAKHVTKADLLPFVTTVDSGAAELVRKQEAGWSYLKVGG